MSDMAEIFTSEIKRKAHKRITLNLSIDFPSRFHFVLTFFILHVITTIRTLTFQNPCVFYTKLQYNTRSLPHEQLSVLIIDTKIVGLRTAVTK